MRYRVLGRTGMRVSELCLGTMTFGGSGAVWEAIGGLDEQASTVLVRRALDAGVNVFDTADGYAAGEAERILGRALGARRREVVIATKAAFPMGPGPNQRGLSRSHLLQAAEDSLRRLGTDYIDLYQVHTPDRFTPLDETMRALDDLVRSGKVRHLGVSNHAAWQIMKANGLAALRGGARFESAQMLYNVVQRDIEREVVPLLTDQTMGLLVWSPLASGALTGKFDRDGKPPKDSRRSSFEIDTLDISRLNRCIDAARPIAERLNASVAQVMLGWLLAQEVVTAVIIGARRLDQLEDNLKAVDVVLSPQDRAAIDAASALPGEYPGTYLATFADI